MIAKVGGKWKSFLEVAGRYDGCIPRGAMVGREISCSGVRRPCNSSLVWRLGGNAVICFCMPARTKGYVYSVGGGVLCQWRRTLVEVEAKTEVGENCEEVYLIEDK